MLRRDGLRGEWHYNPISLLGGSSRREDQSTSARQTDIFFSSRKLSSVFWPAERELLSCCCHKKEKTHLRGHIRSFCQMMTRGFLDSGLLVPRVAYPTLFAYWLSLKTIFPKMKWKDGRKNVPIKWNFTLIAWHLVILEYPSLRHIFASQNPYLTCFAWQCNAEVATIQTCSAAQRWNHENSPKFEPHLQPQNPVVKVIFHKEWCTRKWWL